MRDDFSPVRLPLMGEGVLEATVVRWFHQAGDAVRKDAPLLEVSTDKVDTEIPAPASGFLNQRCLEEGDIARVGQVLAWIAQEAGVVLPSELLSEAEGAQSSSAPGKTSVPAAFGSGTVMQASSGAPLAEGVSSLADLEKDYPLTPGLYAGMARSSPLVRKMARSHGISLHQVPGTGLYGRITRRDFEHYLMFGRSRYPRAAEPEVQRHRKPESEELSLFTQQTLMQDGQEFLDGVPVRRERMSSIRLKTAEHMLRSVRVSPHVTTTFEMDLSALARVRRELAEDFLAKHRSKLTYTAFFLYAVAQVLQKHPQLNASVDGEDVLFREDINLGCAVATESGLIVPVIRKASSLSLEEVAVALNDLALRAREKRLNPQDVRGGTFTLTNPGLYGSLHSQPIISQPQVAILSLGAVTDRAVVREGEVVIRPVCQVGLTFDHRLIDGEGGARFLQDLRSYLEDFPESFGS
ncbi:MAG: 2-oxo acid dehydrogenase subunit E2 [Deltaproteobacteria bacterium]|nr:2-oxo acid dehydrogenase subunit E2 [Deltaproteobacteria bacterium]